MDWLQASGSERAYAPSPPEEALLALCERFENEAAALMASWGWQGNAYFNYAGRTANGTTSLDVSFHLFGSAGGATDRVLDRFSGGPVRGPVRPVPSRMHGAAGGRRHGGDRRA